MASLVKPWRPALILLLPLWLSGCGEEVEVIDLGPLETPENYNDISPSVPAWPREVKSPEEIASRYSSITLAVHRPGERQPRHLQVPLEGELVDGTSHLTARDYLPAFLIRQRTITSDGVEEKNPAAYVTWFEGEQLIFEGWLFRDYPSFNPPRSEGFQLELLSAQ